MREIALPAPGNDEQLSEQVASIVARPLDRARPLWELYLIHGLEGGQVALLTKIHHAVVDGMSGAEIMGVLLDLTPEGREAPPPVAPPRPDARRGRDAGARRNGRCPARCGCCGRCHAALPQPRGGGIWTHCPAPGELARLAEGVQQALGGGGDVVEREQAAYRRGPRSTDASPRTADWSSDGSPLDTVKAVRTAYGATVNDVIVSICAGAVRRWLLEHDELPDEPLVAQIPVSVRTTEQEGTFGNRIMLMSAPLFTNEADPVKRLRRTHKASAI